MTRQTLQPEASKAPEASTTPEGVEPPASFAAAQTAGLGSAPLKRDWVNTNFIVFAHLMAIGSIVYMSAVHFSWWSLGLGFLWFAFCGLAITGGYHRLFSHPTYKARRPLRAFYLFFGAASVQNSALKWSADHRRHHAHTDTDKDPYNIKRGFWWAHMGWIFFKAEKPYDERSVRDLASDPLVRFQDRYYVPLAVFAAAGAPLLLGFLWGDPIGALLCAGFLRLVIQWHSTACVNSVAHTTGSREFSDQISARDSFWTAIITLGEGYHNFHHKFPMDYRNGIKWFQLDPTKWFIWTSSKVGLTRDLRRTPDARIESARNAG